MPRRTPESAARAAPTIQTTVITRSTLIPVAEASAVLSATARVALPIFVRCKARVTITSTTAENSTMKTSLGVTSTGPQCHGRGLENWEYWWVLAPARYWKMLRSRIDSPMLTTIMATRPVPRWRSGPHNARSLSQPKAAEATTAARIDTAIVTLTPPTWIVPGSASTP